MTKPKLATSIRYGWGGRSYARVYSVHGGLYPSVTSVIGMADKPALVNWAAKMSAEYAVDNAASLSLLDRESAISVIKSGWRRSRDKAADFGTLVHKYIETGESPDVEWAESDTAIDRLEALEAFIEDNAGMTEGAEEALAVIRARLERFAADELAETERSRALAHIAAAEAYMKRFVPKSAKTLHEITVVNPKVGYAGTADLMIVKKTKTIVADWKTGKGLYDSAAMQLVALAMATHTADANGRLTKIKRLPAVGHAVRTTEEGYELKTVDMGKPEAKVLWKAFKGLIAVWHQKTSDTAWTTEEGIISE